VRGGSAERQRGVALFNGNVGAVRSSGGVPCLPVPSRQA
jgi:hypothetical protein